MSTSQVENRHKDIGYLFAAKTQLEGAKPGIEEAKFRILDAKAAARDAGLPGEEYLDLCYELDALIELINEMVGRAISKMPEVEAGSRG